MGQTCSQWPPAEMTARGSVLNRPVCLSDDPVGQYGTEQAQTKSEQSCCNSQLRD